MEAMHKQFFSKLGAKEIQSVYCTSEQVERCVVREGQVRQTEADRGKVRIGLLKGVVLRGANVRIGNG